LDWHRKEYGRQRVFQSVAGLDPFDQEVFREVFTRGLTPDDCFSRLRFAHANLTRDEIEQSLERIQRALTPRQLWLLGTRRPKLESLEREPNGDQEVSWRQIVDARPDPETLAATREQEAALERALARLSALERLMLRLRFDQALTLLEIARLTELKDAQTVDRRIRDILQKLRRELTSAGGGRRTTEQTSE
jgi:DNA-directed RNA polymerase specialized sigma subunit